MRVLLLLPNIVLIIISAYNLWNPANSLFYIVLHATVLTACICFSALLIRSIYKSIDLHTPTVQEHKGAIA